MLSDLIKRICKPRSSESLLHDWILWSFDLPEVLVSAFSLEHAFLTINLSIFESFAIWMGWKFPKTSCFGVFFFFYLTIISLLLHFIISSKKKMRTHLQYLASKFPSLFTSSAFHINTSQNSANLPAIIQQGFTFLQFSITCFSFPSESSPKVSLKSRLLFDSFL